MQAADLLGPALLAIAIGGLTAIASKPNGESDKEAALSALLISNFEDLIGDEIYLNGRGDEARHTFCVGGSASIDMGSLAENLSHTLIRPVPFSRCKREIEEGDFGMFTAIYHHFGPDGEEAGQFDVERLNCRTTTACTIDIDEFGGGMRYEMERRGKEWHVIDAQLRWIVLL